MRWLLVAVAIAGCGDEVTRLPLGDMTDVPTMIMVQHSATGGTFLGGASRVDVVMDTSLVGCASLSSNTMALFGSRPQPFTIVDAEYNHIDDFCLCLDMWVYLDTSQFATQPSPIVITDGTTTWTIALAGTDADLTIDPVAAGVPTTATWNGGPPIDEADLWYLDDTGHDAVISSVRADQASSVHINGNAVAFDVPMDFPPQQVVEVDLASTVTLGPTPDATGSSCVGPTHCSAQLNVSKLEAVVQPR